MYGIDFINEISHPTQLQCTKDKSQVLHNIKISIKKTKHLLKDGFLRMESPNSKQSNMTVRNNKNSIKM